MISVLPTQLRHFRQFKPKKIFEGNSIDKAKMTVAYGHPAYTLLDENYKVVGIIMGTPQYDGVLEACALFSEDIHKNKVEFHKACMNICAIFLDAYQYHRIQMTVRCDFVAGQKWAESLGFKAEGIMQKYGADKSDYIMYAKVV